LREVRGSNGDAAHLQLEKVSNFFSGEKISE